MKFWRFLLSMPVLLAGGYVLVSMLWIVFSDRLVLWFAGGDLARVAAMQTWKGLGFVVATGVVIFMILLAWKRHQARATMRIRQVNKQRLEDHDRIEQELNAFVHAVSHDLRAPLRGLAGFSDALREEYGEALDDKARHYLNRIRDAALDMSAFIEGLLHLSKLTRRPLQPVEIDMIALVHEVMDDIRRRAPREGVEVNIGVLPVVTGDREMLHAALDALLDNAWKFTGKMERACIECDASDTGGRVVYSLRDNGVGFDMRFAEQAFRPFQRMHPRDEYPGLGLGLVTAERVIARHRGWIRIESVPDEGTLVQFALGGRS